MWSFVARRLLYAVPILLGVACIVFLLMKMVPGDAVDILIPPEAPREVAAKRRAQFGLDKPVWTQFALWLGNILQGNLGVSIVSNQPVSEELGSALLNTLQI